MTKAFLREQALRRRRALSALERNNQSEALAKFLITSIDWSLYQNVHVFLSVERLAEVSVRPVLTSLWEKYSHITTITNRLHQEKKIIECCEVRFDTPLVTHAWGMAQPLADALTIPAEEIDLFIIPLLACDYAGNRLGYGGGYYDRLLANANPSAVRVGINFFSPLLEKIPHESHDMALHTLFTPQHCFDFYSNKQQTKIKFPSR